MALRDQHPAARQRRKGRPEPVVSALADFTARARDQMALAERLRDALRPDLRAGFSGCDLDPGGTLTVFAAAPEWAALLRFEIDGLKTAADRGGWPVRQIRIKLAL